MFLGVPITQDTFVSRGSLAGATIDYTQPEKTTFLSATSSIEVVSRGSSSGAIIDYAQPEKTTFLSAGVAVADPVRAEYEFGKRETVLLSPKPKPLLRVSQVTRPPLVPSNLMDNFRVQFAELSAATTLVDSFLGSLGPTVTFNFRPSSSEWRVTKFTPDSDLEMYVRLYRLPNRDPKSSEEMVVETQRMDGSRFEYGNIHRGLKATLTGAGEKVVAAARIPEVRVLEDSAEDVVSCDPLKSMLVQMLNGRDAGERSKFEAAKLVSGLYYSPESQLYHKPESSAAISSNQGACASQPVSQLDRDLFLAASNVASNAVKGTLLFQHAVTSLAIMAESKPELLQLLNRPLAEVFGDALKCEETDMHELSRRSCEMLLAKAVY